MAAAAPPAAAADLSGPIVRRASWLDDPGLSAGGLGSGAPLARAPAQPLSSVLLSLGVANQSLRSRAGSQSGGDPSKARTGSRGQLSAGQLASLHVWQATGASPAGSRRTSLQLAPAPGSRLSLDAQRHPTASYTPVAAVAGFGTELAASSALYASAGPKAEPSIRRRYRSSGPGTGHGSAHQPQSFSGVAATGVATTSEKRPSHEFALPTAARTTAVEDWGGNAGPEDDDAVGRRLRTAARRARRAGQTATAAAGGLSARGAATAALAATTWQGRVRVARAARGSSSPHAAASGSAYGAAQPTHIGAEPRPERVPLYALALDVATVVDRALPLFLPSPARTAWDWLLLVVLLYCAAVVPLVAGFRALAHVSALSGVDQAVLVIFWLDILIQFR